MDVRKEDGYNPKAIGERSEGQIIAALLKKGKVVLVPFGDNQRYDCVLDEQGRFVRVQCKTGKLVDGAIRFPVSSSSYHRGGKRSDYRGQADVFGVYCPDTDECFLVPVDEVGVNCCCLRIDNPRGNVQKNMRWAKDYRL